MPTRSCLRAFAVALAGCALLCGAVLAPASSAASSAQGEEASPPATTALGKAATSAGPSERFELGGTWLFRFDHGRGLSEHFQTITSTAGWARVGVPNAWNATDQSRASMTGTVAWYRKDFELPAASTESTWRVRFESVNNRMKVWLNGQLIGSHTGAYIPSEFTLPPALLKRHGVNHLVLRIDSHRHAGDFPGVGLWWNYGGILRKVYIERVDRVGFGSVQVLPVLSCPTCDATVRYSVGLHNYSSTSQEVRLSATYGTLPVELGIAHIAPGTTSTITAQAPLVKPHLWSPEDPYLYPVTLEAALATPSEGSQAWTAVGHYSLRSGVRSVEVTPEGTMLLNGRQLSFRGVGLVEDSKARGAALSEASEQQYIEEVKELGATAIRSQYPLDQHLEELADEDGILLWSEIPVDQVSNRALASSTLRARAVALLRENIRINSNHPSIIVWSIADELEPEANAAQGAYIAQAVAAAHALDPTRLVGLAVAAYPSVACQSAYYAPLDVVGLNDYFGWYTGPIGDLEDREGLSGYLDAMHSCYPNKGLVVSEFGAEANREGPVTERGTYAFQQEFVQYHLGVFATKPWLGGAIYWALQEYRVRPGWSGGNPKPSPPLHTKGLISFSGVRKPAFYDVQQVYRETTQLAAP